MIIKEGTEGNKKKVTCLFVVSGFGMVYFIKVKLKKPTIISPGSKSFGPLKYMVKSLISSSCV
jgi:hypothetical protein